MWILESALAGILLLVLLEGVSFLLLRLLSPELLDDRVEDDLFGLYPWAEPLPAGTRKGEGT